MSRGFIAVYSDSYWLTLGDTKVKKHNENYSCPVGGKLCGMLGIKQSVVCQHST